MASRELLEDETEQDESTRKDQVRDEAIRLQQEIIEWKPKFEQAIELAAAESMRPPQRPPDQQRSATAGTGSLWHLSSCWRSMTRKWANSMSFEIPNNAWSLPRIYWEISAARNASEHYCHIRCPTKEVMSIFPHYAVAAGEPVDGLVQRLIFRSLAGIQDCFAHKDPASHETRTGSCVPVVRASTRHCGVGAEGTSEPKGSSSRSTSGMVQETQLASDTGRQNTSRRSDPVL